MDSGADGTPSTTPIGRAGRLEAAALEVAGDHALLVRETGPDPRARALLTTDKLPTGERMLAITLPHVAAWNAWGPSVGNSLETYLPIRDQVDEACRKAGRDPAEVERTLALVVAFEGALGRDSAVANEPFKAIPGDAATLVATLRDFAEAGVSHVQLVLDPITLDSIAALEPTLANLDG